MHTNGHASDANPFLHDLQPHDQLHATAEMQFARLVAEQHSEIGGAVGHGFLELGHAQDVTEFSLRTDSVLVAGSAQPAEDISGFLFAADFDQPSGRLGEEPYRNEQDDQKDDLEGDGESPAEGGCAVVDEGESTAMVSASAGSGELVTYNSSQ